MRLQPASSEAWRRLGEYYLNRLSQPDRGDPGAARRALPRPVLEQNRADYVYALRASQVQRAEQAAREKRARRRAAAARRAEQRLVAPRTTARAGFAHACQQRPEERHSAALAHLDVRRSRTLEQPGRASGRCRTAAPARAGRAGARMQPARCQPCVDAAVVRHGHRERPARAQHPAHLRQESAGCRRRAAGRGCT